MTTSTWKIPLGTSPRKSGNNHGVIRELEQKLKGRQGPSDFKLSDMSKVSPVLSDERRVLSDERRVLSDERRNSKTLSEKQAINENMLQARARWAAQTKETDETEEVGDTEEFTMSLDATSRFRIGADDQLDTENGNVRSKRAFSNSFPKSQRIIPAPPKSRPPTFENQPPSSGSNSSPQASIGDHPVRVGQRGLQGEKQMKQVTAGTGLKSAAMKKLKKLVKGKNSKSAGNVMAKSNPANIPGKKVGIKKALSENIIIQRQLANPQPQGSIDDSYIPAITQPKDYQNIFDDLQLTEGSRSNTNSPTDLSARNRKPRPLPRRGYTGRHSLGSNDSDMETPPPTQLLSPLVTSPTNAVTPTSAKSDSSTQSGLQVIGELEPNEPAYFEASDIRNEILDDGESTEEDEDLSSFIPQDVIVKKPLAKATSFTPTARHDWDAISRNNTIEQKKLRRAICSDGDQDDVCDDYIKMNSVCLADYSPIGDAGAVTGATPSSGPCADSKSLHRANPKDGLFPGVRSPVLSIPTFQRSTSGDASGLSGLSVPTDEKRSSAYYLKIISAKFGSPSSQAEAAGRDLSGQEMKKVEKDVEFYGEVCHRHKPLARVLSEDRPPVNVVPMDFIPSLPEHSRNKQATKSPTPPRVVASHEVCDGKAATDSSQQNRKFQYTSVTVDTNPKKRTPSAPKKFKYQTVVMGDESHGTTVSETENPRSNEGNNIVRRKLSESSKERHSPDVSTPPVKKAQHPLLDLSVSALRQSERSYYINRKSLIEIESCKDLPTTMLSTVDVATGKVVWHEYVEIDEDQIDKMANSFGVAKSAPIPEKLGMLLGMPKVQEEEPSNMTSEVETADTSSGEARSESEDSLLENDGSNSLNSSMSSECNYIFNLNDPPNIPPRPDNMDAGLVSQLKDRRSGDYSYAFFPQNHLFGKHWIKTTAARTKPPLLSSNSKTGLGMVQEAPIDKPPESTTQRKTSAPIPMTAKATKKDSKLSPPLLPPKSYSLLREQEKTVVDQAVPEPYLMPIIVRTKADKKKTGKETASPTFVSYIRDAGSQVPPANQRTRRTSPPKPLPYLEHKKKQQMLQPEPSSPHNLLSTIASTQSGNMAVGLRYQDTVRRKKPAAGRQLGNRGRPRPKGHKKLARQKTHRGSGNSSTHQGGVHKRRKPRGPRPEKMTKLQRKSLALFIKSEGGLAEKIQASIKKLAQEGKAGAMEGDAQLTFPRRDLSEILVELGNLLKNQQYSEVELLSMISSHLSPKEKGVTGTPEGVESDEGSSEEDEKLADEKGEASNEEAVVSAEVNIQAKKTKPPYVNLLFSDSEDPPVDESSQDKANEAPVDKVTSESKPSYVNLLFNEDDKVGTLENYKPSYVNTKYLTSTSDDELSDNDYNYVEPSEAIGNRRLLQASESMKDSGKSTTRVDRSGMDKCPLKTEPSCTVRPEPAFAPTPRPRSQSSIGSPTRKQQQPPVPLQHHERTLSDSNHPATTEELTEESDLDFASCTSPWNRTGREQARQEPAQRARHNPVQGRASVDVSKGATENTSSYNLALEMEDIRFSRSLEVGTAHKTTLSKLTEEEEEEGGKRKFLMIYSQLVTDHPCSSK